MGICKILYDMGHRELECKHCHFGSMVTETFWVRNDSPVGQKCILNREAEVIDTDAELYVRCISGMTAEVYGRFWIR